MLHCIIFLLCTYSAIKNAFLISNMTLDALTISGNIGLPPDSCITVQYQTIKQNVSCTTNPREYSYAAGFMRAA